MAQLTLLLALFAVTILLGPLAERLKLPYPILLLVFGLLVASVPGLPRLDISRLDARSAQPGVLPHPVDDGERDQPS